MRSRDRIHKPRAAYFVTSTIVAWLPVFTTAVWTGDQRITD